MWGGEWTTCHSLQIRVLFKKHVIVFVTIFCYNKITEPERNNCVEGNNSMKSIGEEFIKINNVISDLEFRGYNIP